MEGGIKMTRNIRKLQLIGGVGTGALAITIPLSIVKTLKLERGDYLDIQLDEKTNKIVMEVMK
jgi:antitoxin component of MazEF toxin-antitoxin module